MKPNVHALLVGAGLSRRFGSDKRIHRLGVSDQTLLSVSYHNALEGGYSTLNLVLRTGERPSDVGLPNSINWVCVPGSEQVGLGISIGEGIKAILAQSSGKVDAITIVLADMPYISPEAHRALLRAFYATPDKIARPVFEGCPGHPVIFPRRCFDRLMSLSGDVGAQSVLLGEELNWVSVSDAGVVKDIDTLGDLS
jgi:molybdenum cofactor cytidylyltransferase